VAARPLLIWNATASTPRGLYRITTLNDLHAGDLVLLRPDAASAALFADRGYLPRGIPLLKPIAAVDGATVCEQDGHVSIDGRHVADALALDGKGRPLTAWHGCRKLASDELFVLAPDIVASLDGRYFGPSSLHTVIGRAIPVWTEGR
jgi:conjugative transfer signal peptidase TraF